MVISVASGKGGTGKTLISTSLAMAVGENTQIIDCDVEEPNAHIFIKPEIKKKKGAFIPVPEVDEKKCTFCGKCQQVCEYKSIAVIPEKEKTPGKVLIFEELCHGCGACSYLCPEEAIKEKQREVGIVKIGSSSDLEFVGGKMNIGEAMAPPVIREVKKSVDPSKTVIIDAPPGTTCPTVTSIQNSDYCILVTEPTPFGLNDLMLAVDVLKEIKIPFGVVVNRSDLGDKHTDEYCEKEGIEVLLRIPFSKKIAECYSKGIALVDCKEEYRVYFRDLIEKIKDRVEK